MRHKKIIKATALFLLLSFTNSLFYPSVCLALTSGPGSPEFSSFEPVATTDMVNIFSGDFTYNLPVVEIPGPDGGGYALSLSYHSGTSCEEEASWVGYGWTLNPGAINRNVKGFPDEYNGDLVKYYNKTRPNWTISTRHKASMEFFSKEKIKDSKGNDTHAEMTFQPTISVGTSLRFNNYQGFARGYSIGAGFGGMASINMEVGATGVTFSADINPVKILNKFVVKNKLDKKVKELKDKYADAKKWNCSEEQKTALKDMKKLSSMSAGLGSAILKGSSYGISTFSLEPSAMSVPEMRGYNINFSADFSARPAQVPIGFDVGASGTFSFQNNIPKSDIPTYGYLHNPSDMGENMSDYYVERNQPFDKQDLYLGIPFSNPDNFSLTGEGLAGGFRVHEDEVGHFYPNKTETKMKIFSLGVQLAGVTNLGVGLTFGFGVQKTAVEDWKKFDNANDFKFNSTANNHFWKFTGDLGGKLQFGDNKIDNLSTVIKQPNFPGISSGRVRIEPAAVGGELLQSDVGRTSFVSPYSVSGKIEGFSIYNADGTNYHYGNKGGQPNNNYALKTRNEANISVGLEGSHTIYNNHIVKQNLYLKDDNGDRIVDICTDNNSHDVVVGDIKPSAYANTFLINQITSYDYIDANTNDFADDEDLGGWTRFEYTKLYGDNALNGNWYRWRAPYQGLNYQKNDYSDTKDDLASVSTGEKEIAYLNKITTKTHTAYFVTNKISASDVETYFGVDASDPKADFLTGSNFDRTDGLGAIALGSSNDPAANDLSTSGRGSDKLKRLEKIVLFANDRPDKPIKTVYFQYDYHLVPNLPNSSEFGDLNKSGKLTLTKVWSEYEGTVGAKVSPYEFNYAYKPLNDFDQTLVADNPALASFFNLNNSFSAQAQNPEYKPYLLDAWGNNQARAMQRHDALNPWLYQGNFSTNENFDPAAWQLKQIKLPSGGEILIEYEQKDYQYVQDRRAMAMASLTDYDDWDEGVLGSINKYPTYDIKLSDLGFDVTDPDYNTKANAYMNELKKHFVDNKNRIFFKFLYALKDNNPSLNDCRSEYIDGYCKVSNVERSDSSPTAGIRITFDGDNPNDAGYSMVPRQGAYDFYATQRVGKYEGGCEGLYEATYDDMLTNMAKGDNCEGNWTTGLVQVIEKFGFATLAIINMEANLLADTRIQIPFRFDVAEHMSLDLSYLKLPMPEGKSKRGGGIRVKRLLMYDGGIETGDAAIYGSDYKYVLPDGTSSGVATTEPSSMREENALVDFLPKKTQSWFNRHTVGSDKEQSEGPIGESLLPGAAIGHSRVVIQNIHTGKTGTGFSVNQFYTVKDYPFDKDYDYTTAMAADPSRHFDIGASTSATEGGDKGVSYTNLAAQTKRDFMNLPTGFFNYSHKRLWAAQAFRFIMNEMHGQTKSVEQFQGDYGITEFPILSSSSVYKYYEPGEQVAGMKPDNTVDSYYNPGKEMEIVMESKNVHDNSLDFDLAVDLDVGLSFFPPIFVTFNPSIILSDKTISTHSTSKVIKYPSIVKSVQNFKDGIWASTENIGFDMATGAPILTRTTDSYHGIPTDNLGTSYADGSYYNLKIPAHWHYAEMGGKYLDDVNNSNQLNAMAGSITTYGTGANPITSTTEWQIPTTKVVSASANTYAQTNVNNTWTDVSLLEEYDVPSTTDLTKIWRPLASYVYKTPLNGNAVAFNDQSNDPSNATFKRVFESGLYNSFSYFDYQSPPGFNTPPWIKLTEVKKYSPHGSALEEVNNLGIYSAARYGYNFTQPVMIAKNAQYSEVQFDDFENDLNTALAGAPAYSYDNTLAHSGSRSITVGSTPQRLFFPVTSTNHLVNKGALVKLWVKSNIDLSSSISISIPGLNGTSPSKVAQTGEWTLYNFTIPGNYFTGSAEFELVNNSGSPINVDDIRIQPKDAQSTCYVYDLGTLRLITQFDDQHFGLYYQYNSEGKLVRKLVETERGLKTIQETQYNKPTVVRPQ